MNNAIYIPWSSILFFLNSGLYLLLYFSWSSKFLLTLPSICPIEVFSCSQSHVFPFFSFRISLWNLSSFLHPSSSLVWTGCCLSLSHRCPSSITFSHCPRNPLPLSSGFFCFLDLWSSPFIVYFCFVGVSPPVASSFIHFLVLRVHFLQ